MNKVLNDNRNGIIFYKLIFILNYLCFLLFNFIYKDKDRASVVPSISY